MEPKDSNDIFDAERHRQDQELERARAEESRITAELTRATSETGRLTSEKLRHIAVHPARIRDAQAVRRGSPRVCRTGSRGRR